MLETDIKVYYHTGIGFSVSYLHPFTKKRVREKFERREDAESRKADVLAMFQKSFKENPCEMIVQDLLELHLREQPKTQLSKSKQFLFDFSGTFGHMKIKDLTTDVLRSWLDQIQFEGSYKESSMFGFRVKLNIFFRDMVARKIIETSPIERIFYEKRSFNSMRKPIILSEAELRELAAKAKEYSPGHFYPLFLTFIETGAKSSEILELTWDGVDFKTQTITFPTRQTLASRSAPISKELADCLLKKKPLSEYVFTSLYDEKITKRKLSAYINDFKRHYSIKEKWMYYDLRHSFAHNFLSRGGSLKALKEALGVRSLQTAEVVYGQYRPKELLSQSPFES